MLHQSCSHGQQWLWQLFTWPLAHMQLVPCMSGCSASVDSMCTNRGPAPGQACHQPRRPPAGMSRRKQGIGAPETWSAGKQAGVDKRGPLESCLCSLHFDVIQTPPPPPPHPTMTSNRFGGDKLQSLAIIHDCAVGKLYSEQRRRLVPIVSCPPMNGRSTLGIHTVPSS